MKKIFFLIIFILFINFPAIAAERSGVTISPSMANIEINQKQKTGSFELTLDNNTQEDLEFDLSVVDFGALDDSGGVAFLTSEEATRKYALASWVTLEKDTVMAAAGKTEKVKVTVNDRESLSPGGHYGAVLAKIKTEAQTGGEQVSLNQSVSTLIYVLKSGGEIRSLKLNNVQFLANLFKLPDEVTIRFENNGNVHLVPRGMAQITDSRNRLVAKGIINAESSLILPESLRKYEIPLKTFRTWKWPGRYTLTVNYRYDGKTDFGTTSRKQNYVGWEGVVLMSVVTAAGIALIGKKIH